MLFSEHSPTEPRPSLVPSSRGSGLGPGYRIPRPPPLPDIPQQLVVTDEGNWAAVNLFRRHKKEEPSEGALARAEAERTLAEHQHQTKQVHEVAGSLRQLREENHFADNIKRLWEESVQ